MAWTRRSALAAAGIALALALGMSVRALGASHEQTMTSMVAASRHAAGVPALRSDPMLTRIARAQSERMRAAGRIFHNDHIAPDLRGARWTIAGENVGSGPSMRAISDGLMRSSVHRHNILDPRYNAIGIGIATSRSGGLFVTQVFAHLLAASAPPARAEAKISPSARDRAPASAPSHAPLASLVARSPAVLVRAEDGSLVRASFFARWCERTLTAEDGTRVRASYYDDCDGGRAV